MKGHLMADKHFTITQERLNKLYEYNPDTGLLMSRIYNRPVGYDHNGYLAVELEKKHIRIHRIIWMIVHGRWPEPMIDHINGNRKDNRLCNLREVTAKQNIENSTIKKTKSGLPRSGYKGVHWNKQTRKWVAAIGHQKKTIYLGSFNYPKEGHFAYVKAAKKYHTHNPEIKA
jgi:hypothetical protein